MRRKGLSVGMYSKTSRDRRASLDPPSGSTSSPQVPLGDGSEKWIASTLANQRTRTQIPHEIRDALEINDDDRLLWMASGSYFIGRRKERGLSPGQRLAEDLPLR